MPRRKTAPAGPYVLIGVRWRRQRKDGGSDIFEQGDVVDLTAEEAARLVGQPHSSFRTPPEGPAANGDGGGA